MKRSLFALITSALLVGSLGIACGDGEPDGSVDDPGTGGTSGTGGNGDTLSCSSSQELCGDFCASVQSDPDNCGFCGTECGAGEGCLAGQCADFGCRSGQVVCSDACVNLQSDAMNCGECGEACAGGQVCSNGQCETSCAAGLLACDSGCIDPNTDASACGATDCSGAGGAGGAGGASAGGVVCDENEECVSGVCQDGCPSGQITCGGSCVSPLADRTYCGAANCAVSGQEGTTCESFEACVDGACTDDCPAGQIVCNGNCISPAFDDDFCGASGACDSDATNGDVCSTEQSCVLGDCREFIFDWSEGEEASDPAFTTGSAGHDQGTDALGNTLVVWRQFGVVGDEDTLQIWARRYLFDSKSWTAAVRIDNETEKVGAPRMSVSPNGDAIAVWDLKTSLSAIKASTFDAATNTWSPAVVVDDGSAVRRETPRVASDSSGNAWVVWSEELTAGGRWRVHRNYFDANTGMFTGVAEVSGYGEGAADDALTPVVAMNSSGDAAVAWLDRNTAAMPLTERVLGMGRMSGGAWTVPEVQNVSTVQSGYPTLLNTGAVDHPPIDLGVDASGAVYLVWNEFPDPLAFDFNIFGAKLSSGTWGTAVSLADDSGAMKAPRIATDAGGTSILTYYRAGPNIAPELPYEVFAVRLDSNLGVLSSALLSTVNIDTGAATPPDPIGTIDGSGNVHVVWTQDDLDVFTSRFDAGLGGWGSARALQFGGASGQAFDPIVTTAFGGRAFASWYWAGDMRFARFD